MKYSLVIAAICLALSAGALRADEGRIPIAGPTTITAQGHYILTRDVQVSGDTGIVVDATHVTLDLNGHILSTSLTTNHLIEMTPTADFVTIRNGRLSGGSNAIYDNSTVGIALWVEGLEIDGATSQGITVIGAAHVELLDSRLVNNNVAMFVQGLSGQFVSGRIVGNTIGGGAGCLSLLHPRDMQIRDNMITSCGNGGMDIGIGTIPDYGGNLIEHNTISGCTVGIDIALSSPGNQVVGNVLKQNAIGIAAASASNRIAENTIFGSTSSAPCGGGLCIQGPFNLIEGNAIGGTTPGCAIRFFGASALNNAYRSNMLRNNPGGQVCATGGGTATDAGGNIF